MSISSHAAGVGLRRPVFLFCLLVAALVACDRGGTSPTAATEVPPDIRAFVTGEAAQGLAADGRFAFPASSAPAGVPMLTAERARDLAIAYVRGGRLAAQFNTLWEEDRGGPINLKNLEADRRVYFSNTLYEPVPDHFHPGLRNGVGPYYLVTLRDAGEPVLLMAVAAYATDLGIDGDGRITYPMLGGNFFLGRGLAPGRPFPILPEEAVARVGRTTGARVTRVPELMQVAQRHPRVSTFLMDHAPTYAVWKLVLDRPVIARTQRENRRAEVREVYIREDGTAAIPAQNQPAVNVFPAPLRPTPPDYQSRRATLELPVRPEFPAILEEATLDSAGGES